MEMLFCAVRRKILTFFFSTAEEVQPKKEPTTWETLLLNNDILRLGLIMRGMVKQEVI